MPTLKEMERRDGTRETRRMGKDKGPNQTSQIRAELEVIVAMTSERVIRELLPEFTLTVGDTVFEELKQWRECVVTVNAGLVGQATELQVLKEELARRLSDEQKGYDQLVSAAKDLSAVQAALSDLRTAIREECVHIRNERDKASPDERLIELSIRTLRELRDQQRKLTPKEQSKSSALPAIVQCALDALENCQSGIVCDLSLLGCESYLPGLGDVFDPKRHTHAKEVKKPTKLKEESGRIAEVLTPGFIMGDRVLAPAEVVTWTYLAAG